MTNKRNPTVNLGYPTDAHGKIPAFHSVEEEAEFWDTHDTEDFREEFEPVEVTINPELVERLTIRLDRSDREALERLARRKGIGPSTLARMWIREHIDHETNLSTR